MLYRDRSKAVISGFRSSKVLHHRQASYLPMLLTQPSSDRMVFWQSPLPLPLILLTWGCRRISDALEAIAQHYQGEDARGSGLIDVFFRPASVKPVALHARHYF